MTTAVSSSTLAAQHALDVSLNRLEKSLARISSGSRLVGSSDDAAGQAVAMKLDAAVHQLGAFDNNLQNAGSFLDAQEKAMSVVAMALTRIEELKVLKKDATKNPADIFNYTAELETLKSEIFKISNEKLNGIRLFSETSEANYIEIPASPLNPEPIKIIQPSLAEMVTTTRTIKKFRRDVTIDLNGRNVTPVGLDYLQNRPKDLINNLGSPSGVAGAGLFGETVLDQGDDNSSQEIDITSIFGPNGLNFNGRNVRKIYVNNNGNITFTDL